jgi:hypothetical protein
MTNPVFVLAISHEYGTDISVYSTEEKARDSLYGYVNLWWGDAFDDEVIPEDQDEAISQYFQEKIGEESFQIDSCVIDDTEGSDY